MYAGRFRVKRPQKIGVVGAVAVVPCDLCCESVKLSSLLLVYVADPWIVLWTDFQASEPPEVVLRCQCGATFAGRRVPARTIGASNP